MKSPIFALFVVFMKSRISAGVGSFNKADTIVHEIQDKKMNDFNPIRPAIVLLSQIYSGFKLKMH